MIVPQTYRKIVLSEDGTIKTELFTVSGRKIPLSDHQGLVRTTKDEHYATMTTKQADDKLAFLGETHNLPESYSDWVCTAVMSNDVVKDLRGWYAI